MPRERPDLEFKLKERGFHDLAICGGCVTPIPDGEGARFGMVYDSSLGYEVRRAFHFGSCYNNRPRAPSLIYEIPDEKKKVYPNKPDQQKKQPQIIQAPVHSDISKRLVKEEINQKNIESFFEKYSKPAKYLALATVIPFSTLYFVIKSEVMNIQCEKCCKKNNFFEDVYFVHGANMITDVMYFALLSNYLATGFSEDPRSLTILPIVLAFKAGVLYLGELIKSKRLDNLKTELNPPSPA